MESWTTDRLNQTTGKHKNRALQERKHSSNISKQDDGTTSETSELFCLKKETNELKYDDK
jgi:hypothetical protein